MQLDGLKNKYTFPDNLDEIEKFYFSLDGGGRDIIVELIQQQQINIMIEVGYFLCGSTIQWLDCQETFTIIGIDPWEDDFASQLEYWDGNPVFDYSFSKIKDRQAFIKSVRKNGPYISALANVQKYKDRFVPVKGHSPQALYEISSIGVEPQLIYLDSNKVLGELDVSLELFPDAILSGDDWMWGKDQGFPVQKTVKEFCQKHGFSFTAKHASWIIHK